MKQFLVLLVFTLGKEYRVRHRVLCVVVLGFGSSLCSLCCGCSICVKNGIFGTLVSLVGKLKRILKLGCFRGDATEQELFITTQARATRRKSSSWNS